MLSFDVFAIKKCLCFCQSSLGKLIFTRECHALSTCWPEESEQQQEEEEHRDPHRHSSKGGYGGEEGCTKKGEAQPT